MNQENPDKPGTLYLVATPIGNLEDITLRAINTLKSVDYVAAEDTRHTRKLLSHYDIHVKMLSYREQNKVYQGQKLLTLLKEGNSIAVCSDAGMPLISDPGEDFVRLCIDNGINVTVVPGPSAVLSALVLSGFSANTFLYLGFAPRRKSKKRPYLESLAQLPHTLIFYESPFRVVKFIGELLEALGDRNACVAREITKIHEEMLRGKLSEILARMKGKEWKGEFTLVVEGAAPVTEPDYFDTDAVIEEINRLTDQGVPKNKAYKMLADKYHTSKRALYTIHLESESSEDPD